MKTQLFYYFRMILPLSENISKQIESNQNDNEKSNNVLKSLLDNSITHNFDSQARFLVSIIALRLLKRGFKQKIIFFFNLNFFRFFG